MDPTPGQPGEPHAPRPPIELPEPALVVLIGAAGAGKSTLAARLFPPDAVLSSDAYRAKVSGDPGNQRVSRVAFELLHRELERRLAAGLTTLVDATNVTPAARRTLAGIARRHGVPMVAIVLDLDPALVLARNAAPGRLVVPEAAVRRQLDALARALRPGVLEAEGFSAVHRLRSPADVEAFRLRTPR